MKTNRISTWAALLAVIGGTAALPLTVSAQSGTNKYVTSGTWYETGSSYQNTATQSALQISGSATFYSGTNLTLSATNASSGNGRYGAFASGQSKLALTGGSVTTSNGASYGVYIGNAVGSLDGVTVRTDNTGVLALTSATVSVTGGSITTTGSAAHGVWVYYFSSGTVNNVNIKTNDQNSFGVYGYDHVTVSITGGNIETAAGSSNGVNLVNNATGILDNVNIKTVGSTYSYGVGASYTSTLTMTGGSIVTEGDYGAGVNAQYNSNASINNVNITTSGSTAHGIWGLTSSTVSFTNGDIATSGASSNGVVISNTAVGNFENVNITTSGNDSTGAAVSGSSALTITGGAISTSGSRSHGASVGGTPDSTLVLNDVNISAGGPEANGVSMGASGSTGASGTQTLVINGGSIDSAQGDGIAVNVQLPNPDGTWPSGASAGVTQGVDVIYDITIDNGASVSGSSALDVGSVFTGTDSGGNLITNDKNTVVNVTVSGSSTLTGDVNTNGGADVTIDLDDSQLTGDLNAKDDSTLTISGSNGSTIIGDVTGSGSSTIDISISGSNSTITGGINGGDDSRITISGSNGVTVTGTANGSDNAVIDITVSGPGGSFVGDLNQNDHSQITVTIDDGARGQGGFNGGDLNVLGPDSVWDFDQDSHVNNGHNEGTLNIGDKDVIFDNLVNTGTVNIHVDTDRAPDNSGSVTVTGTAGGNGTVHIDTEGNGTKDPNDVLNDIVKGDGTEDWTWDPIDWGFDEVVKDGSNPDGSSHFGKSGKYSTAGAVLNSSAALQQTMWFAQQNSLLKRMGDLRFDRDREVAAGDEAGDKQVTVIRAVEPDNTAGKLLDNVWIRSYGQQLNVGGKVSGHSYEQLVYGVDLGSDLKWVLDGNQLLYTGVFLGYGRSDVDYRVAGAEATLNSYYGGIYATWLHDSGWYIDLTFKAASVDNELKAPYGASQLTAEYNDLNLGGSIEIGRKFSFGNDWFIEPQLQVNYLHLLAEDYNAGPMSIRAKDLDAVQFRIGGLFGKTIRLANGGVIQPYLRIGGVEMVSSGGAIRNGYQSIRSNIDGARAELGGGLVWQLDEANQLHLDYEASFGDKYDKPWGLTAGFRHQF